MRSRPFLSCMVVALILAAIVVSGRTWYQTAREWTFDAILSLEPDRSGVDAPIVIDIDRESLAVIGPWPWRRDHLAKLLAAIAAERPAVLGLDILLDGPDELSPAAMARKLAAATGDTGLSEIAGRVPDGDRELASAIDAVPFVLGMVLDPNGDHPGKAMTPILVRGQFEAAGIWQAEGFIAPPENILLAAKGLGLLAMSGDADGAVRRIPLLAGAGNSLVPGFALEIQRLNRNATAIILSQSPLSIAVGTLQLRMQGDGMLRLIPARPRDWPARTISAKEFFETPSRNIARIKGRVVLVGSSAPEAGGLRLTAKDILAPTVQLQADTYSQLESGVIPFRPGWIAIFEGFMVGACGVLGAHLGLRRAVRRSAVILLTSPAILILGPVVIFRLTYLLIDPLLPSLTVLTCFIVTAVFRLSEMMRREAALRRRFEQHLAPAVVRRIIMQPDLLRLAGEVREVTALFTDIEGFTAMTERASPRLLIACLDDYFDGVSRIVISHGGLIDKIVGDAVHALFNAPLDLDDHPRRALECAVAVQGFALDFCQTPRAMQLRFGETRIGLETGKAIVGDVGGTRKLDYTAHGNAINAAARFEAANKDLGTTLCIGPGAAELIGCDVLRPLGKIVIKGRTEPQEVFTLWPVHYPAAHRSEYMRAFARTDQCHKIEILQSLSLICPDDLVLRKLCERSTAL